MVKRDGRLSFRLVLGLCWDKVFKCIISCFLGAFLSSLRWLKVHGCYNSWKPPSLKPPSHPFLQQRPFGLWQKFEMTSIE